ncbi:MAG: rhombosortase [Pseudomonadota bacterium]|nr:rhombosortase [Pseudomonadota bacterium]
MATILFRYVFPLMISLICTIVTIEYGDYLIYDRELMAAEPYRFLTSQWTHATYQHYLINAIGFTLVGYIFYKYVSTIVWLIMIFYTTLAVSIAMFAYDTELMYYTGFSGALYGLLVFSLFRAFPHIPKICIIAFLFIIIRLYLEQTGLFDVNINAELLGGEVWVNSHLYGALSGVIVGGLSLLFGSSSDNY